jgi:phosphoribosylformylglycinamidine synthase
MGGSRFHLLKGIPGGVVPRVDLKLAPAIFRGLHEAIRRGLIRACHDLSEGGLAVAVAEMAFAGGIGVDVTTPGDVSTGEPDEVLLFAESATRFVIEVKPEHGTTLRECLGSGVPLTRIGQTIGEPRLRVACVSGEWVIWARLADLKEAWQKPLRW